MSVDLRTRTDSEQLPVEAGLFFRETLPAQLDPHQAAIAPGASALPLEDFCIETDGEPWTLAWRKDRVSVKSGRHGKARVLLDAQQLSDIVNDQSTPIALMSNQLLEMPEGGLPDFLNWWLVLRAALDGRRIYAPGDVSFENETRRSFTPDDSNEEMRAFLEEAGYLHIQGLFSEEEMAAVEADFPKAVPHYEKGDPKAWFATAKDGVEHLVRMEGFERYSSAATQVLDDPRFLRIGDIPGVGHRSVRKPGERCGALTKPIGVVQGISDLPWHKDCSLGRHSYECCTLTVGISVTGADADSGQLRVVPGSHRAMIWPAPCLQPGLDLEAVDLPTRTGDVTVHLSCTLHMSQAPVSRTRKVLYTGFRQRPVDPEAAEVNRRRLNSVRSKTHTSISQEPGYLGD
ncbi:MAG: phytanoyl-CoA dioxygenase family protein [Deltaproteobacteria bacterium]|nr:phytanoyl-CoA dioxygenase family protein [Deltaproteobacteria bacterium]